MKNLLFDIFFVLIIKRPNLTMPLYPIKTLVCKIRLEGKCYLPRPREI